MNNYSVSEVVSALSYALDLTEGLPMGHALRTCMLGMRLAKALDLPVEVQADLYYALLLKDTGCSSNASRMCHILGTDEIDAKRMTKTVDWTRPNFGQTKYLLANAFSGQPMAERLRGFWKLTKGENVTQQLISIRCERGANIARRMGLSEGTAEAIHNLDEHWNGAGYPMGLKGQQIPMLSRIANLAQNLEVFYAKYGPDAACAMAKERSGRWFDPTLVRAAIKLHKSKALWTNFEDSDSLAYVLALEPEHLTLAADQNTLDNICVAFADVIDAKSPFTLCHSVGVSQVAVAMGEHFGLEDTEVKTLQRAALLHDIGKLGVPNSILEKDGKLTPGEWQQVVKHPHHTYEILGRITGFEEIKEIAASHHEKLDGTGYYRGLTGKDLPLAARILSVADIYDALAAKRPYRAALPTDKVFSIIKADAPHKLDGSCFEVLNACVRRGMPEVSPTSYLLSLYSGITNLTASAQAVY